MTTPPGVETSRLILDILAGGSVVLTPTRQLFRIDNPGDEDPLYVISQAGANVGLDQYVDLAATDAANIGPKPFQWRVQFALRGLVEQPDELTFDAPAGATQYLSDLVGLEPQPGGGLTVTVNGDTLTLTGSSVADHGDGTFTLADPSVTDNGDGTYTITN